MSGNRCPTRRVREIGVGDGSGDRRPVCREPAAEAVRVVAGAEVVVAGFGVALLALELVIVGRGAIVGVGGALAAVRVEIRVVTNNSSVGGNHARGAEHVFNIVNRVPARRKHGDALAAEENVLGGGRG